MRKPFFKAVVAGMASVAMIAGMSACGRSANNADSDSDAVKTIDSSKATGDLTIWAMGNEGDLLGDFVKGFEKENPDVKVKVTAIPWSSAHDKLQTAIAAGNGPDVAQMGTTWMADFSNSFSTVPDNLDMSDFSDGSRATGQVDGNSSACLGTSTPECCTTVPTSPRWLVGTKLRRLGMSLSRWLRTCRRSMGSNTA